MEAGLQLGNLVINNSHIAVSQYLTKIQNSELLSQELIHRDHAEMTPLYHAVRKGDFEMVKVLLSFQRQKT